jgi:hypothetical protein
MLQVRVRVRTGVEVRGWSLHYLNLNPGPDFSPDSNTNPDNVQLLGWHRTQEGHSGAQGYHCGSLS